MFIGAIAMMLQVGAQPVPTPTAPPPRSKPGYVDPLAPETWVVEYPRIIADDVDAYYGCLKSRGVSVSNEEQPLFEEQHRAHIPLCAKQLSKSLESANSILIGRNRYKSYTPEIIAATFRTIELIHVERGRKIDKSLVRYLERYAAYDAAYEATPEEVSGGERITADLPSTSQETSDAKD